MEDVARAIKGMSDGAPGPDRLSLNDLKGLGREEVAAHFKVWLLAGNVPSSVRRRETVLIAKEADATSPEKHRLIATSDIILQCFHKILASQCESTLPRNSPKSVYEG